MRQRGFSLLEILVAFTILALSLGVLMQIFSGSLRNTDIRHDQALATAIAESLLAGQAIETTLAAGDSTGSYGDRFRWLIHVTPFEEPIREGTGQMVALPAAVDLWQVAVSVAWDGGSPDSSREVRLTTLRVQPRAIAAK